VTYQEFDNVVVPVAENYNLKITAEGTGTVVINSNYAQEISGDTVIGNLKKLSGLTGYATFTNTRYNNIRFYGDIAVSRIEVEIVNKTYGDVNIVNATCDDGATSVLTDLL
jgi:hypothetical protein